MSTPITISLYYKGKQKDYDAIFTNHESDYEFKVVIDDITVNFEGNFNQSFHVKNESSNPNISQADPSILEAVSQQLNQIFF